MLSDRFGDALKFAEAAHRTQRRKGTDIPYVAHLLAVAAIALEHGGDEDQAIAALLHDAVEDQGGRAMEARLRAGFGDRVADIVMHCTDAEVVPKPPWRARKEAYVAGLAHTPPEALLVSMADKLHNAQSILADHAEIGEDLWARFKGGRDGTLWYYRALSDAYAARAPQGATARLAARLAATVAELEARTGVAKGA